MLLPHPFAMEMKTMNRNGRKYQNANVTIRFNEYQSRAYTYRTQSIRIYGQSFLCCFLYIYIFFPCCVAPFRREAFDTKQAIRRHCVVAYYIAYMYKCRTIPKIAHVKRACVYLFTVLSPCLMWGAYESICGLVGICVCVHFVQVRTADGQT